jgi:hypothetical protein
LNAIFLKKGAEIIEHLEKCVGKNGEFCGVVVGVQDDFLEKIPDEV